MINQVWHEWSHMALFWCPLSSPQNWLYLGCVRAPCQTACKEESQRINWRNQNNFLCCCLSFSGTPIPNPPGELFCREIHLFSISSLWSSKRTMLCCSAADVLLSISQTLGTFPLTVLNGPVIFSLGTEPAEHMEEKFEAIHMPSWNLNIQTD